MKQMFFNIEEGSNTPELTDYQMKREKNATGQPEEKEPNVRQLIFDSWQLVIFKGV